MPYKQSPQVETAETARSGAVSESNPKGLGSEALGHPADGAVFQRSECDPYKVEVAGSNPARPIQLTRGFTAWVSPEDYERVSAYKWTAMPCGTTVYAKRVDPTTGTRRTVLLIRELIAANTWPRGWDGTEAAGDAIIDRINRDGTIQPLLLRELEESR